MLDDINLPEPGAAWLGTAAAAANGTAADGDVSMGVDEEAAAPAGAKVESRSATAKLIDAMPKVADG